jgi:hypothetical protein
MAKIVTDNYGILHCIARCEICGLDWDNMDTRKARREAKKHTRDTGHYTIIETGSCTKYSLVDD